METRPIEELDEMLEGFINCGHMKRFPEGLLAEAEFDPLCTNLWHYELHCELLRLRPTAVFNEEDLPDDD